MRRHSGKKFYGPYQHGDKWRVHVVETTRGGRTTAYEAYETRAEAEHAIARVRDATQGVTVKTAVDAYLQQMRDNGCVEISIESVEDRLFLICGMPTNDNRPLRWLIGRGDELYATSRVNRKPDTHLNALQAGRALGKFCIERGWLRVSPFAAVKPVGSRRLGADKPHLRTDESRKLYAYCLAHVDDPRAVLTLSYLLLGTRASELRKRNIRDLDDDGHLLWIGVTKTRSGRRRLSVPNELREILLGVAGERGPDDPLFLDWDGKRWTTDRAFRAVKRTCKLAGVPVLASQALRRTQSTLATEAGVAALAVSAHLGHAGTKVTARSYVDPNTAADARGARAFKVIMGGKA